MGWGVRGSFLWLSLMYCTQVSVHICCLIHFHFHGTRRRNDNVRVINFTKLNYFIFEMLKKKIGANFQINLELFTQKIVSKLSKIWVRDPGSGKNLFRIPDPGVKKAPDPGSRMGQGHFNSPYQCAGTSTVPLAY